MATGEMQRVDELKALVDELEDLETRRSGSGGLSDPKDAQRRSHLERILIQLLGREVPVDERREFVRVPCDLPVKLHVADQHQAGRVVNLGAGGVFVETPITVDLGVDVDIEVERQAGALEHSFRVRGRVVRHASGKGAPAGLGLALRAADDPSERRLRRLVVELLRKRLPN